MSSMLTPEVVEAIARNAGSIKAAITSGDEMAVLGAAGHNGGAVAAAPALIKFKFVLCDVEINNVNAVAAEPYHKPHC